MRTQLAVRRQRPGLEQGACFGQRGGHLVLSLGNSFPIAVVLGTVRCAAHAARPRFEVSLSFLGSFFGTADSVLHIERIERVSRPQPRGALGGHMAHASLAACRWMRPTWFHLDASQRDVLRNTVPFVQYELAQKRRTLQHRLESQLQYDSVMSAEMSWFDKARRRPETS